MVLKGDSRLVARAFFDSEEIKLGSLKVSIKARTAANIHPTP
jgi:hypothetical protein